MDWLKKLVGNVWQILSAALIGVAGAGLLALQQAAEAQTAIGDEITMEKLVVVLVMGVVARLAGYVVGLIPNKA